MAMDKRTFINIAAATITVLAVALTVMQCEDGKKRDAQLNKTEREMAKAKHLLDSLSNAYIDLIDSQDDLRMRLDSAVNARDSIAGEYKILDDSLARVASQLEDCQKCKKKTTPVKKQTPVKKPVVQKPVAPQPTPAPAPAPVEVPTTVVVTPDSVAVRQGTKPANGSTDIKVDGNNNTVNVNNGVIVNNYNGVNPADTLRSKVTVVVRRTITHTY